MPFSNRICPRCGSLLEEHTLDAVAVDHCSRGCGTFLDRGETGRAVHPILEESVWVNEALKAKTQESKLLSPVDQRPMVSLHLDAKPELVIERCVSTGGLWLDDGECSKLYDFVLEQGQAKDHDLGEAREHRGVMSYLFQLFSSMPLEVWHPTKGRANVMWTTLTVIGFVFIAQIFSSASAETMTWWVELLALQPDVFSTGHLWQLLTYGLLHGGAAHFIGNAFMLYLYGDNVEDVMGSRLFLQILLYSTVAGGLLEVLMGADRGIVGLSGGIAGVMGAYFYLFPKVKIRFVVFFIVWRFPAWLTVAFWVLMQFVGLSMMDNGVAYWAHLGGLGMGLALAVYHGGFQTISQRIRAQAD